MNLKMTGEILDGEKDCFEKIDSERPMPSYLLALKV